MSEEETFKALKRVDYETALSVYLGALSAGAAAKALKAVGWTYQQLTDEYNRRNRFL